MLFDKVSFKTKPKKSRPDTVKLFFSQKPYVVGKKCTYHLKSSDIILLDFSISGLLFGVSIYSYFLELYLLCVVMKAVLIWLDHLNLSESVFLRFLKLKISC